MFQDTGMFSITELKFNKWPYLLWSCFHRHQSSRKALLQFPVTGIPSINHVSFPAPSTGTSKLRRSFWTPSGSFSAPSSQQGRRHYYHCYHPRVNGPRIAKELLICTRTKRKKTTTTASNRTLNICGKNATYG